MKSVGHAITPLKIAVVVPNLSRGHYTLPLASGLNLTLYDFQANFPNDTPITKLQRNEFAMAIYLAIENASLHIRLTTRWVFLK